MKVVNIATYVPDRGKIAAARPSHRHYVARLMERGKLIAGGPFADGSGALFLYEVASLAEAQAIVAADPYTAFGTFANCELKLWEIAGARPDLFPAGPVA
ncbi:YciI family protein [Streptomyces sp. NPDC002018]|uniref:YciI family protein n=1 Tax=Streptomyces sp. NPDC002018 TaxID=3364629 RepID=UPI0036842313